MPISYSQKCIFVHIPKTGGTSIKAALNIPHSLENFSGGEVCKLYYKNKFVVTNHAPAKLIQMFHPSIFEKFIKFSVVRNPYDRVLSQYFYNVKKQKTNLEFSVWFKDIYTVPSAYMHCPQYDFLYDENVCLVENILKFENLENDFFAFCKKYNISTSTLPKLNVNELFVDKESLLTETNKEYIYNKFEIDFKTFNYEK